jgi:hypothetical protein
MQANIIYHGPLIEDVLNSPESFSWDIIYIN